MKQLPDIEKQSEYYKYVQPVQKVIPANEHKFSYHFLKREKRSQPFQCVAFCYVAGDCCQAKATTYFEINGFKIKDYSLQRIVDNNTWIKFQVTQHLKQLRKF